MSERLKASRLFAEGLVIVLSILLALAADAWWDSRQDQARVDGHLRSLAGDFAQMSVRAESSLAASQRAVSGGRRLLQLEPDGSSHADSIGLDLRRLLSFEAFSPSTGAYEALVASGDLELIEDERLKTALREFFGAFEDVRVSEAQLRAVLNSVLSSPQFTDGVGMHRIFEIREPLTEVPQSQLVLWLQADHVASGLTRIFLLNGALVADYEFIESGISDIRVLLPTVSPSS